MILRDTLASFRSTGMSSQQALVPVKTGIRVAFLSQHLELKAAMQRALSSSRYVLTQVCSIRLVEKAIENRSCDVAIVDIERQNEWPGAVFSRFDEAAAAFPIIILCKKKHQIVNYLWKAQSANDIVSYESISDPRFLSLIEAAVFRAEVTKNISIDYLWDPSPLPTA